ncbi:MAG: class I SAM-dependent rRNA methyltransferase [Prevotellaceae bacterium]|jgi:23S rRNA (cytosine1962-C5)-methyltransferase|nr:class I SAM-dependent rRNA methyltransferase [Prevotellaceae bacterium]
MTTITLKPKKEESIKRFHPWVFSGAIAKISGKVQEGDLVRVVDCKGDFLGIGHYQIGSITVRIVSFEDKIIDRNFWADKIRAAYLMRKNIGVVDYQHNNAYRLIHGEGDNLPALVVDVYDSTAVLQAHSVGMYNIRHILAEIIVEEIAEVENVFCKSEGTLPFKAPVEPIDEYLIGEKTDCIAKENDILFYADWLKGQKTGFFIDQRENRSLLKHYAKNRDVLNMFCYTGGFSLYAMSGGANLVHSVDSSAKAISLTDKNIEMNFANDTRHKSFAEDAFKFLENIDGKYDLIILDPPAFAKHRDALKNALQGYKRLNARAIEQIRSGGILFTFSCSQAVSKEQFRLAVFSAAAQTGRNVKILHQLTQAIDHPINIYHPEGEYLKGLVVYVE